MSKRTLIAFMTAAALGGAICGNVFAANADPLKLSDSIKSGDGIFAGKGESPEALAAAAKLGITKYEDVATEGGGGAPQKTLLDNDVVKVNLAAFKKGFVRPGGVKRRYDTMLIYVDPGRYTIVKRANGVPVEHPAADKPAPGSVVFHRRESIVSESHIDEDYRVLFVMVKH